MGRKYKKINKKSAENSFHTSNYYLLYYEAYEALSLGPAYGEPEVVASTSTKLNSGAIHVFLFSIIVILMLAKIIKSINST
jgi:hypothetical protein